MQTKVEETTGNALLYYTTDRAVGDHSTEVWRSFLRIASSCRYVPTELTGGLALATLLYSTCVRYTTSKVTGGKQKLPRFEHVLLPS
jgi:hypothetical protein